MPTYEIKKLPSGFYSVWYGSVWMEASLPSEKAAEEFIKQLKEKNTNTKK